MIHPDVELRLVSPEVGHGLFATRLIPKGTITYVDDPLEIRISPKDPILKHPVLGKLIKTYSILENDGLYELSWDLAKHMNHCCHSNTVTTGWGFDIAVRDILPGEQVRCDYGMFNVDYEMELICENSDCRKQVKKKDFDQYADQWEAQVQDALALVHHVPQVLLDVMEAPIRLELERYLQTGEGYRSVRELQYSLPEE
ncbi:MAG: hypothetical protein Fur0022_09980 [Anaerolineales bacterium]